MNLVERAKKLILKPKEEWQVIAAEPHTLKDLYTGYVMILAAIPAVASFIGLSLVGLGSFRVSIGVGVAHMIVSYVLSLASVYVLALLIDALAPSFDGEKNFMQALKVAAFSPTASWLAGIFMIIPLLSILSILGLYSLYLLYLGLPPLMKAPAEKAIVYTVVIIIAAVVLYVVVAALTALIIPSPVRGF